MERLTFNIGRARMPMVESGRGSPRAREVRQRIVKRAKASVAAVRERYDADYLWMLAFTFVLFFRPQDQIPGLAALHLSEVTAIAGLVAMASRRLASGQTVTKMTPELVGVMTLGGVILFTVPFSTWPGGSAHLFSDVYVKIILTFALMITTLTSPKRVWQMTWVMLVTSGYIAARAVFDYVRGVNLVEGDRVRGAVSGIFGNPNDLALNLVTFIAPALIIVLYDRKTSNRCIAAGLAVIMLGAVFCTKSRGGFLGLIGMALVVAYYMTRRNPAAIFALIVAGLLALPAAPSSFWDRMDSIVNAEEDATGSREARIRLMQQGFEAFLENPITGVGAGQFQNYNMPGVTIERWRVTHNVWLQVAAELGIFGVATFAYLVYRAFYSCAAVNRMLRRPGRARARAPTLVLTEAERTILVVNAKGMTAAMVGWAICALFASVAFNWTFYYLLALATAGREVAASRRAAASHDPDRSAVPDLVRAHA